MPVIGADSKDQYSQRYISEIIGVRLEELFDLVLEELYRMGVRDLPGGVVLTGGITKLDGILQLARHVLKTRVRIHTPEYIGVREPMYSTAVGLIRYAHMQESIFRHVRLKHRLSTTMKSRRSGSGQKRNKPTETQDGKSRGFLSRQKKFSTISLNK